MSKIEIFLSLTPKYHSQQTDITLIYEMGMKGDDVAEEIVEGYVRRFTDAHKNHKFVSFGTKSAYFAPDYSGIIASWRWKL